MIVVDASAMFEVVAQGSHRDAVISVLLEQEDAAAPAILDAEVVGIIRRDRLRRLLDATGADVALHDLRTWPGARVPITPLIERAWELRENVRVWDAFYVALAEALEVPLITMDHRLARATGPRCEFITIP